MTFSSLNAQAPQKFQFVFYKHSPSWPMLQRNHKTTKKKSWNFLIAACSAMPRQAGIRTPG